jgi:hypothetical protein
MAKKLVLVAVLAVAGLAAYNLVTTGKVGLIPSARLSPEEQQLAAFEERLRAARRDVAGAGRAAGVGGLDTTSDVEAAMRRLEKVEEDLQAFKKKAKDPAVRERCDGLIAEARSLRGER